MLGLFAAAALLQSDRPLSPALESTQPARLFKEDTFIFAPDELKSLAAIDLWLGEARLKDSRCLILKVAEDGATRQPVISNQPDACAFVSPTTVTSAVRCPGLDKQVGLWRIGCRKERSLHQIFAVHVHSGKSTLLAGSEQEMLFASAFPLHDWIMIRTLTLRNDGTAVISYYDWHPPAS